MLSFEEKVAIVQSFPELLRKEVSLGRVNFHYEKSAYDKKIVVYHLHPNGNGFVYAGLLQGYDTDGKGFVNIREYAAEQLRSLIDESIRSLSVKAVERSSDHDVSKASGELERRWSGPDQQLLLLKHEDDLWYVYAGLSLESAFETYEEAEEYLREEGFSPL